MSISDPTLDFLPLYGDQDEETILGRMIGWANEGLDPVADADRWTDTREGGHWRTTLTPAIREIARLYDLIGTEVPMSGMVLWAWEVYLDDLAAAYDVQRKAATYAQGTVTFTGPVGSDIPDGHVVGVQPTSDVDTPPTFRTIGDHSIPGTSGTGSVDAPIQAVTAGAAGDVAALRITVPVSPLPGITFTNTEPTTGGADTESDDSLRSRTLDAIVGKGPGNLQDYVRWAGGWAGVGRASVVPVWNGAGTVLVMVSDPNGLPLPSAVVTALQANLDPVSGTGAGTAPVGAAVTVETSTLLNLPVDATMTFMPGYTWDGAGGSIAVEPGVMAAIQSYYLSIAPGGVVRLSHVAGIIATATGVDNVASVLLNGAAADVTLTTSPAQVAILSAFTAH